MINFNFRLSSIIPFLAAMLVISSCDKQNQLSVKQPVASFTTDKTLYEEGDMVHFINNSKNAVRYFWQFSHNGVSTEVEPSMKFDIPGDFISADWVVMLVAYNELGDSSIEMQHVNIGRRMLRYMELVSLDSTLLDFSYADSAIVHLWFGKESEPEIWKMSDEGSFREQNFCTNADLPIHFYWPHTFPTVILDSDVWFVRIYQELNGNCKLIKHLLFEPTRSGHWEEGYKDGSLLIEGDGIAIKVGFRNSNIL